MLARALLGRPLEDLGASYMDRLHLLNCLDRFRQF